MESVAYSKNWRGISILFIKDGYINGIVGQSPDKELIDDKLMFQSPARRIRQGKQVSTNPLATIRKSSDYHDTLWKIATAVNWAVSNRKA